MLLPSNQDIVVTIPSSGFRRWINSDMRILRWVFVALYLALVAALMFIGGGDVNCWIVLPIIITAQLIFIFGAGTMQLCRPIRRRRLALPIAVSALALSTLLGGFIIAMSELLRFDLDNASMIRLWALLGASWIIWGVLLWNHVADQPRYRAIARLTTLIFAGSLAELLATIPAHLIVSRRPGCFVGLATMFGIVCGICVMLFCFGPMIVLLFLRPRLRRESFDPQKPFCPSCGYDLRATPARCPECGLRIDMPAMGESV